MPSALAVEASVFLTSLAALTLGAIAALVLGCGMPPTAVYIILASLTIPAMTTALEPINTVNAELAAHFFAFHFSTIAAITPPVALAAYAAASLSGGDPFQTGFTACKVGLVAFVVPYMFAYSPELLLEGSGAAIASAVMTASIGVVSLAAGTHGFLWRPLAGWARVLLVLAGLLLIKPGIWTDLAGFGLGLLALALGGRRARVPIASPSSSPTG